jgi:NAD(P)-dependent dehydrogenase (short-subunit alcohol dehydrogenase family)
MSKTIVITGSSDGIGAAGARQLKRDGHHVVVVGRSPEKTAAVARELESDSFVADFARFDDVRALAADLEAKYPRIDVLVNNAGGVFGDRTKTADGFEKTLQVNHLSPFLLTNLLLPNLLGARASVIQTSSDAARLFGKLDLDDLDNDRKFTPRKAYGDAKLENILFTTELHRRFHDQGLSAAAFHPGSVATSFATQSDSAMRFVYNSALARRFLTTPDQGAKQLVWLAAGTPGTDWHSGDYYEKSKPSTKKSPQAKDAELARRLWERSAELVGLPVKP